MWWIQKIAEKMMDHKIRMEGHYFKPTKEELFEEYKKAIPELIIDDSERLRLKNEQQSKTITKLEVKTERIEDLERRIRMLEKSKEN